MKYMIIYKDENGDTKELFENSDSAAKFIEELLKDKKVPQSDIELFQMEKVEYQVEHIPVVTLEETADVERTGNETAGETDKGFNAVSAVESSNENDNLEVFTFDS